MTRCERMAVVGVDFTEMGDDAIHEALVQLASGALSLARFVFVLDPRELSDDPEWRGIESEQDILARAPRALQQRVRDVAQVRGLPYDSQTVRVHARRGHIVSTLIEIALEHDADLLILGTHARLGLDRRVLGPVADAIVRHAPCPVLIARPKSRVGMEETDPARHTRPIPAVPLVTSATEVYAA